jgi:hypothetical protein
MNTCRVLMMSAIMRHVSARTKFSTVTGVGPLIPLIAADATIGQTTATRRTFDLRGQTPIPNQIRTNVQLAPNARSGAGGRIRVPRPNNASPRVLERRLDGDRDRPEIALDSTSTTPRKSARTAAARCRV